MKNLDCFCIGCINWVTHLGRGGRQGEAGEKSFGFRLLVWHCLNKGEKQHLLFVQCCTSIASGGNGGFALDGGRLRFHQVGRR